MNSIWYVRPQNTQSTNSHRAGAMGCSSRGGCCRGGRLVGMAKRNHMKTALTIALALVLTGCAK